MAVILTFGPVLSFFSDRKRFSWFKLATLELCLPLTSIVMFFISETNGLHILTLGMSMFIMILVTEEKYRWHMIGFNVIVVLLVGFFGLSTGRSIVWPETLQWWYAFYLLGFIFVLLYLKNHLQILAIEKEMAIQEERNRLARNISHDIATPMMVLRMLSQKNQTSITNEKKEALLQDTLKEIASIVDSIVPGPSMAFKDLPIESLNGIIEKCLQKRELIYRNPVVVLEATKIVSARIEPFLFERVFMNLLNTCAEAVPSIHDKIVITLQQDEHNNVELKVGATGNGLSFAALNAVFNRNEKIGQKMGLGSGVFELICALDNWQGEASIVKSKNQSCFVHIKLPSIYGNQMQMVDEDQ